MLWGAWVLLVPLEDAEVFVVTAHELVGPTHKLHRARAYPVRSTCGLSSAYAPASSHGPTTCSSLSKISTLQASSGCSVSHRAWLWGTQCPQPNQTEIQPRVGHPAGITAGVNPPQSRGVHTVVPTGHSVLPGEGGAGLWGSSLCVGGLSAHAGPRGQTPSDEVVPPLLWGCSTPEHGGGPYAQGLGARGPMPAGVQHSGQGVRLNTSSALGQRGEGICPGTGAPGNGADTHSLHSARLLPCFPRRSTYQMNT